jgi:hypothetical protein
LLSVLEILRRLAGRQGGASAVDEKLADELRFRPRR